MMCRNGKSLQRRATKGHDIGMRVSWERALVAAALLFSVAPLAEAAQPPRQGGGAAIVRVSKQVLPPLAHARFCLAYPGQCMRRAGEHPRQSSFEEQLAELASINLRVNREITPQEDGATGGRRDEWVVDTTRGDCEDYALSKRKRLLAMGWSSSKLRIATALTPDGTGHAVLIVRLSDQDVVLDNLTGVIRPWYETGYRFLKIQSDIDPNAWFAVQNLGAPAGGRFRLSAE